MDINIGIDSAARTAITEGLSRLLADSYALFLKTHNYHWNVTGPMFQSLHALFEVQYTELFTGIDAIAERIRALGSFAPGSFGEFSRLATVADAAPNAAGVPTASEMLRALVEAQEAVIRTARSVIPHADAANDQATLDLLTRRLDVHEKNAWMLRSLLG